MTTRQDPATRPVRPNDIGAVLALYSAAFPDEDLSRLVLDLTEPREDVAAFVSDDEGLLGHVAISFCGVDGVAGAAVLLGPLAVAPARQRAGIGSHLVATAIAAARDRGAGRMLVLGDPRYYSRFGFGTERDVTAPYPLPPDWADAWQGLALDDGPAPTGALQVPPPWQNPDYWSD